MRWMGIALVVTIGCLAYTVWAGHEALRREPVAIMQSRRQEHVTMVKWVHWKAHGVKIDVEVYRRDYDSDEAFEAAVDRFELKWPPNEEPPAPG